VVPVTACEPLTAPASGLCTVTPGSGDSLLLEGDLLTPEGLVTAGQVLIAQGAIACVGCQCAAQTEAQGATRVSCPQAVISPGLVNAHDHITFTQMTPVDPGDVRYDHRHEWRKGATGKPKLPSVQNAHKLGDAWGEMRQVMGGTTSLFGSGGEAGFLRNLDRGNLLEGLSHAAADYSTFPLGDSAGDLYASGCGAYTFDDPVAAAGQTAYVPHVAEGINPAAHNEFVCVSGQESGGVDLVLANAAFIHGIGLETADIALMAADSTGLVWSPRSNTALYGATAPAPIYARLGVPIAIGSDWTASGSVTLLRELACARSWNQTYWGGFFSDAEIFGMATYRAADLLGFGDLLGSLVKGKVADITVWRATERKAYRAVLEAEPEDVWLVLRGGLPLYGQKGLLDALAPADGCEEVDVCGEAKRLCAFRELGVAASTLASEIGADTYGLFFCGVPDAEPSCVPWRPAEYDGVPKDGDQDGDGVADPSDNCPAVFNPPRPLDGGAQPDADLDQEGDLCDPCPFDPDTEACTSVNPDDVDADGFPNPLDNCVGTPNPDQDDGDQDGLGNLCDPCASFYNPGGGGCPVSVYDIKLGKVPLGQVVTVSDLVVTAVAATGFFGQLNPSVQGYAGIARSGIYVYAPGATLPKLGDLVSVVGTVADYFGQTQLAEPTIAVTGVGAAIDPAVVLAADLGVGGAQGDDYEAVLVRVLDAEVVDVAPVGEPGEVVTGEFVIAGGLSVDDFLYLVSPLPPVGQVIPSLTGVVRQNWNRKKLNPRGPGDLVLGLPALAALEPALSWIYRGQVGLTAPSALRVRLTHPGTEPVFVAVTSSLPYVVAVVGGGVTVPAGEFTADLTLDALDPGGPVDLTATLDGKEADAAVTVLGEGTVPNLVALQIDSSPLVVGGVATVTLWLDLPAPPQGLVVELDASTGLASLPATLEVAPGAVQASFEVEAGPAAAEVVLTATLGAQEVWLSIPIEVAQLLGMLLVEVVYDTPGEDDKKEWVMLYNGTGSAVDLGQWSLGYGGADYTIGTYQLTGLLPKGQCAVVGGPDATGVNGAPSFWTAKDFNPDLQNSGSTADGVALFKLPATQIKATSVPIDAVVFGGANGSGLLGPDGKPVPVPHVADAPAGSSLVRTGPTTWSVAATPYATPCIAVK
jgi:cytosine/adenosine deaminase-related metal-dependent hydrolase